MFHRSLSARSARMRSLTTFLLVLCFCLSLVPSLRAQASGKIEGTVVDSSQAVVPGARLTCKNVDTGLVRTVETNAAGIFAFPDLPIGQYTLAVSRQGFKALNTNPMQLLTGQELNLPLVLEVGDVSQSVQVTSEATLVQTASSAVETSVTEKQMADLPLNGRNAFQLTALTPGTVITNVGTESGQQDNQGLSVNGLRATQNNFQLDGALYTNRFFDSVPTMPSPDALQEFTIQTAGYSAQYGGAGALIQLSTRSGSNELHGSAFEFLRNTDLNARNFFNLTRPPYKLNQFGGTAGGPIRKNKTFFFFSAQDTERRSSPSPVSITTPTAAQRTGDFSALLPKTVLTDPKGGSFPGNIIPTSRLDPITVKIANALVPLPNSGTQWIGVTAQNLDDTQYLARIDQMLGNNNHLSGHYFYDQDNFQRPFSAPTGFFAENLFRNQTGVLRDTYVFNATTTLSLDFNFGPSRARRYLKLPVSRPFSPSARTSPWELPCRSFPVSAPTSPAS